MNRLHHLPHRSVYSWLHSPLGRTTVGLSLVGILAVLLYGLLSMVQPSPAPYGALRAPAPSFRDVSVLPEFSQPGSGVQAEASDRPIDPTFYPDLGIGQTSH